MAARYIQRVVLTLLLFLALSNTIARAGDEAAREIIGFSADGRYFAFEQYGVQDGSGFPYSEIFVIDAVEDEWVDSTPVRMRIADEKADLRSARAAARKEAASLLSRLGIGQAGLHLASNPNAAIVGAERITVNPPPALASPNAAPITFYLQEKTIASAECAKYSDKPMKGFSLAMAASLTAPPKSGALLHDDEELPASRGCPLGYAIADVLSYAIPGGPTTYAVLLHMQTIGFEGPNRRFLAVTHICRQPDCGLSRTD